MLRKKNTKMCSCPTRNGAGTHTEDSRAPDSPGSAPHGRGPAVPKWIWPRPFRLGSGFLLPPGFSHDSSFPRPRSESGHKDRTGHQKGKKKLQGFFPTARFSSTLLFHCLFLLPPIYLILQHSRQPPFPFVASHVQWPNFNTYRPNL